MYNRHPGQNLPKHGSTPPCPKVGGCPLPRGRVANSIPLQQICVCLVTATLFEAVLKDAKCENKRLVPYPMETIPCQLLGRTCLVVGCRLKSRMFSRGWRMRISAADKKGPVVSHRALLGSLAAYVETEIKEQSPMLKPDLYGFSHTGRMQLSWRWKPACFLHRNLLGLQSRAKQLSRISHLS